MSNPPAQEIPNPEAGVSRRSFVRKGGAALAAGLTLPAIPVEAASQDHPNPRPGPKRPNLLILITDQERFPQHWPEGWADRNLPNRKRLARHGLTFTRAYCNAAMCSPSRATLFTGLYAPQHGVLEVLETGSATNTYPYGQMTLRTGLMNMAKMLENAGYDVQYRGKWHMSRDPSGMVTVHSPSDLEQFRFKGWVPPDASDHTPPYQGGGEVVQNDALYAEQAAEFLRQVHPHATQPFALVVCLVNPHDIMGYWKQTSIPSYSPDPQYAGKPNYGPVSDMGIQLPPTYAQEPNKPACQAASTTMWATALGPLDDTDHTPLDYVNFYAGLHALSDQHLGTILDALEANPKVHEDTLVFRMADHGEMGLAHGGMRQKAYNAYEETVHIPMVISNPKLFPKPVESDALVSLIDVMPTLASIVGAHPEDTEGFRGTDLTPIIQQAIQTRANPTTKVQDSILFTTDETIGSRPSDPSSCPPTTLFVHQPAHIRCLCEENWKFALYFDPANRNLVDYELYDLVNDPHETRNLGRPGTPDFNKAKWHEMCQKLVRKLQEEGIYW